MDASGSDERSSLPDAFCPFARACFARHLASPLSSARHRTTIHSGNL
jgi:hypothetical protein